MYCTYIYRTWRSGPPIPRKLYKTVEAGRARMLSLVGLKSDSYPHPHFCVIYVNNCQLNHCSLQSRGTAEPHYTNRSPSCHAGLPSLRAEKFNQERGYPLHNYSCAVCQEWMHSWSSASLSFLRGTKAIIYEYHSDNAFKNDDPLYAYKEQKTTSTKPNQVAGYKSITHQRLAP